MLRRVMWKCSPLDPTYLRTLERTQKGRRQLCGRSRQCERVFDGCWTCSVALVQTGGSILIRVVPKERTRTCGESKVWRIWRSQVCPRRSQGRSQQGPTALSSDICDEWRRRGALVGSTIDEVGNSLYQPITMLLRSSSSNRMRATPMKHLRSMRP